jgi:hypothetical protein
MLASFFTAMSWFRSWASYFSGYKAVPPGHIGRDEGKKIHARTVASAGG